MKTNLSLKLRQGGLLESVYDNLLEAAKYGGPVEKQKHRQIISQKRRLFYYKKLKKSYGRYAQKLARQLMAADSKMDHAREKTVWFLWLQGLANAPEIVRLCHASQERQLRQMPGWRLVVLDETNMLDYAPLPAFVLDKWKRGVISSAHLSDLLRLELLTRRGGIWIDATVFLTDGSLLRRIAEEPVVLPSQWYFFSGEIMKSDNWLIAAEKNNVLLLLQLKLLYAYWKQHDYALDYFLFHLFWTLTTEALPEAFGRMPVVSKHPCELLQEILAEPCDESKVSFILAQTGIHKLSHKIKGLAEENEGKRTVYGYLKTLADVGA